LVSPRGYGQANLPRLLRHLRGGVHGADTPKGRHREVCVGATVALLRYGSGMPHYRLGKLQQSLGVPLPGWTQWELMHPLAQQAQPILEELITQAAQSPLIHHDDTTMRILDLRRPGQRRSGPDESRAQGYLHDQRAGLCGRSPAGPLLHRLAACRRKLGGGASGLAP